MGQAAASTSGRFVNAEEIDAMDWESLDRLPRSRRQTYLLPEAILNDLANESALSTAYEQRGSVAAPLLPTERGIRETVIADAIPEGMDRSTASSSYAAGLAFLGLAVGFSARATGWIDGRSAAVDDDPADTKWFEYELGRPDPGAVR